MLIYFFQFIIDVLVKNYEKGGPLKKKNKASSNASIEVQQGNQGRQIGNIKKYWHSSKQRKMNVLQLWTRLTHGISLKQI